METPPLPLPCRLSGDGEPNLHREASSRASNYGFHPPGEAFRRSGIVQGFACLMCLELFSVVGMFVEVLWDL